MPSCLATLSAIQSRRSSLGQMQDMQGFAGPATVHASHRVFTDFQSFSGSQLAPAASVVRRQGGTEFAIRTITMIPRQAVQALQCLPRGFQFIPTSARRCTETSEPSSQITQLPASDSPDDPGRVSVACQRDEFPEPLTLRTRCSLERRLPTVTEMRAWRVAHGPGLHGPPECVEECPLSSICAD